MFLRQLAEVIGTLVATEPGVEMAPVFYRRLDIEKAIALRGAKGNFEASMTLSEIVHQDLRWWIYNMTDQCSQVQRDPPQVSITSDSSDFAWGGTRGSQKVGGPWSGEEQEWHINVKELTAVLFTLRALCADLHHTHIHVLCDNTTATLIRRVAESLL